MRHDIRQISFPQRTDHNDAPVPLPFRHRPPLPERLESSTDIGKTSATFTNPIANYQSSQRREGSFRSGSSSGYRQTKPQAATGSGSIHRVEELATGMHINHTRFGHGIIMLISEISGEPMIMAKFDQVGEKNSSSNSHVSQ